MNPVRLQLTFKLWLVIEQSSVFQKKLYKRFRVFGV